jgi:phospholipid/cholesterol/gamma-HCH transport system ATP-binding protein
MYDEPFAGQDPIVKGVLTRLIRSLREALDLTTIIVSHDVEETMSIADYIYIVAEGIIQGGHATRATPTSFCICTTIFKWTG